MQDCLSLLRKRAASNSPTVSGRDFLLAVFRMHLALCKLKLWKVQLRIREHSLWRWPHSFSLGKLHHYSMASCLQLGLLRLPLSLSALTFTFLSTSQEHLLAHEGFPCSFMPSLRHVSLTCFFSTGELVISAFKKVHIHRTSFGNQLLIWTCCLFVFICVSFLTPLNACCLYGPLPCTGYGILLLFIDLLKCTDSISSMTENTFYFISHNVLRIHSITQASGL